MRMCTYGLCFDLTSCSYSPGGLQGALILILLRMCRPREWEFKVTGWVGLSWLPYRASAADVLAFIFGYLSESVWWISPINVLIQQRYCFVSASSGWAVAQRSLGWFLFPQLLFSWPLSQEHWRNMRCWEWSEAKVSKSDLPRWSSPPHPWNTF